MKPMTAEMIARVTGGRVIRGNPDSLVTDVCTDSRQAGPGRLFVPVIGAKVDGHSFIPMAEQLGAAAVGGSWLGAVGCWDQAKPAPSGGGTS